MARPGKRVTLFTAILALLTMHWVTVSAREFFADFEGTQVSWKVMHLSDGSTVRIHERRRETGKDGGSEFLQISTTRPDPNLRIEHVLPDAIVLKDELEVSLWVKSNHAGLAILVRIVLPDVLDPVTHQPLAIDVVGDKYETPNHWQQLKCRTTDRAIETQLGILRSRKQILAIPKEMFVDRVALSGPLPVGSFEYYLDNLTLSPLVLYQPDDKTVTGETNPRAIQTHSGNDGTSTIPISKAQFEGHRFYLGGSPFFPRIITGQGERPEVLTTAGVNVVYLSDYKTSAATASIRRQGLQITSTPPYAKGVDGEPLDSEDANISPFQDDSSAVLFWTLGTRMTLDGQPRIASWSNQVRNADRRFLKRAISADIIEDERSVSRNVDMVGLSKHFLNTGQSVVEYREGMIDRRNNAWPDTFIWTWVQTEPSPMLVDLARKAKSPPMLEPEQIRMQVYAALAAGCRGIGYWTTTPLDQDSPSARERLLTISQLNLELELYEPWTTTCAVPQLIPFQVPPSEGEMLAAAKAAAEAAAKAGPKSHFSSVNPSESIQSPATKPRTTAVQKDLQAALFRSDQGFLVLPMWFDNTAQFVPGPMAARNVSIVVPGAGQTAAAWEISTSCELRHLESEQTLGGRKIKLPRFDQTAAILITSNLNIVDEFNQKIRSIQDKSAQLCVELAKSKLNRIQLTHDSLSNAIVRFPEESRQLLGQAKQRLQEAETAFRRQEYSRSRQAANEALQYGRLVQFSDWDRAVSNLSSPTKSPWTLSFQSLPEHEQLLEQLATQKSLKSLENLLPSGEFEDWSTISAESWKSEQAHIEGIESSAELYRIARQGQSSLRLSASSTRQQDAPRTLSRPLVSVVSPGITVHAGQIVYASGWAKVPGAISGGGDGVMIYDSLLGKTGAIRLKSAQDWKRFEFVRPVHETQDMTMTFSLQGFGEVFIDDLQIVAFEPPLAKGTPSSNKSEVAPTKHSTLDSIRRLSPIPVRR